MKSAQYYIETGEAPQILVPKGYIFGSSMNSDGFSLVGCMVAPTFTFDDFELFEREELLNMYPNLDLDFFLTSFYTLFLTF